MVDTIVSFKVIFGMRSVITQTAMDSTINIKTYLKEKMDIRRNEVREEFDKLICDKFSHDSKFRKRIIKVFPNIHIDCDKIKNRIEKKRLKRKKK